MATGERMLLVSACWGAASASLVGRMCNRRVACSVVTTSVGLLETRVEASLEIGVLLQL
jgi:hypothetical protein